MYNGHQSNTALVVDISTMTKMETSPSGRYYNSHSFGQRAVPYGDGFLLASEGDCYSRAFNIGIATPHREPQSGYWYESDDMYTEEELQVTRIKYTDNDIFHFWVKKGTFDKYDMWTLNENFADLGGIAVSDATHVALVGASAKNLDKKASRQKRSLFIQIFDPTKDLSTPEAYYTTGNRSGLSGGNGDEYVTDYGVLWLTNGKFGVANPQVITDHRGRFVILFEKMSGYNYAGAFYAIVDKDGKIAQKVKKFSPDARLNACETPKCIGNTIYWTANNGSDKLCVYKLKIK